LWIIAAIAVMWMRLVLKHVRMELATQKTENGVMEMCGMILTIASTVAIKIAVVLLNAQITLATQKTENGVMNIHGL
jgi:hypothetical protein